MERHGKYFPGKYLKFPEKLKHTICQLILVNFNELDDMGKF